MLVSWRYRPHNSWMERLDPRTRWIFSFAFLLSATMFWDARALLFFTLLAAAWYFSSRVTWQETRRGWMLVSVLLFTMIVINTILTGGGAGGVVPPGGSLVWADGLRLPWGGTWHFGLTYERLWFALCQLMRIGSISAIFLMIPYTLDPRTYGVTFARLGLSDKLAYSMELAFRYVPTLARDFNTTYDAQRARGYKIERMDGGVIQQIMRIAPLVIPVTMNAILSGEDITNAMDLRCFGQRPRTWLHELKYQRLDILLIGLSLVMLAGSFILTTFFKTGGFWVPEWWLQWFGG